MPKFTFVSNTNQVANREEAFLVHRAGCSDISKAKRRSPMSWHDWTVEADTAEEAVRKEAAELADLDYDADRDFYIYPCCRG